MAFQWTTAGHDAVALELARRFSAVRIRFGATVIATIDATGAVWTKSGPGAVDLVSPIGGNAITESPLDNFEVLGGSGAVIASGTIGAAGADLILSPAAAGEAEQVRITSMPVTAV